LVITISFGTFAKTYFRRTKQQQENDFVEEKNSIVTGYEFKWSAKRKLRLPEIFRKTYNSKIEVIDRDNFRDFVILTKQ